ncbi:MAG: HAD family phosphatase [Verrucomicrobiota bacterium]
MVRSFIFDIGNVLIPFDFNRALRRIAPQCVLPPHTLPPQAHALTEAYESGKIGRPEFLRQAFDLLQYRGTEAEFIAAWEDIFEENHAMTGLIGRLRERYPLYLLSNTSDIHSDYFESKYPVFQAFSGAVYSYLAGCIKPSPAIFEIAIRQFGVEPAETVYIDDLHANVAAAARLGFQALHYDFTRHPRLVEQLTAIGVEDIAD